MKRIRESRNVKTNKDSVTQTEINNKKRLLKSLDFMANIIEAAKEENIEKNKNKIKNNIIKDKGEKLINLTNNKISKSIEIK